ncbi:hypothetical protein SEPCBS57363_003948 [Sporothrix epigloea]|uniref:Suppressor of anucleate metulae protein B n=1 Tax=Sporothrix epigloea TaxID=1892477 RepID=A0ABP0DRF8_9PEZI
MLRLPPGLEIRGEKAAPDVLPRPRGRGLFAKRRFEPGEEIAVFSEPMVVLPAEPNAKDTCSYCLDPYSESLKLCAACRAAAYCTPACQRKHWGTIHKFECKLLKADSASSATRSANGATSQPLPAALRALKQLILQCLNSADVRAAIEPLEGNVSAFRAKPELWKEFESQAAMVCKAASWSGDENAAKAVELLCRIHTSAISRRSKGDDFATGIFLDTTLSMANHSCLPNAIVVFTGRSAFLRAQHPIAAGEEITISYTECTEPLSARKQKLDKYNFECDCRRCRENLDNYQATQISPVLSLNTGVHPGPMPSPALPRYISSIGPSIDMLRNPPIVRQGPDAVTPQQAEDIYIASRELIIPQDVDDDVLLQNVRDLWHLCAPLIKAKRWADEPLPELITVATTYCNRIENYPHQLALACFGIQHIDPYMFPAPFSVWRNMGLMNVAKTISLALSVVLFGDDSELAREARGEGGPFADPRRIVHPRVLDVVSSLTDNLLHLALMAMVGNNGPLGHSEDWLVIKYAQFQMDKYASLPGSGVALDLIRTWFENPYQVQEAEEFFDENIMEPLNQLSALVPEILEKMVTEDI